MKSISKSKLLLISKEENNINIKAKDRLGLTNTNNYNTEMKIIKVLPNDRVIVQFNDNFKFKKEIPWNGFKSGNVKNPYDKTVYGVGYIGVGKYKTAPEKTRITRSYEVWRDMFARCYVESQRHKHLAYAECTVCDKWHNYQTFARWYDENYYVIDGERMHIDKDILVKDNKIYSPETCIFVPQRINMIFMSKEKKVDNDLPNAIYRCVKGYKASYGGKSLGVFKTLEEAIENKDKMKRIHIRKVIDEYKNILPENVVSALLNW